MKTHQQLVRSVEAARHRLAKHVGSDILFVPISIVDSTTCGFPVACITAEGIQLTDRVVQEDPLNLEVYIAHEIFHEVIEDESLNHLYTSAVLNESSDFKINQLLQECYGYDVLKVKYKGLRNPDFDKLTVEQIANVLTPSGKRHFSSTLRHPLVTKIAAQIRRDIGYSNPHKDILKFNFADTYYSALRSHYSDFRFENLPNVNPDFVVRNLWVRLFQMSPKWNHSAFDKTLTHSQALSIMPRLSRLDTYEDAELSMFAALHIVKTLNSSQALIRGRIKKLERVIERKKATREGLRVLQARLLNEGKRRKAAEVRAAIDEIPEAIKRLNRRIRTLAEMPSITDLLTAAPSVSVRKAVQKTNTLSGATFAPDTPKFDASHPLAKHVRFVLKSFMGDLEDLNDLYNQVSEFSKDFAPEEADLPEGIEDLSSQDRDDADTEPESEPEQTAEDEPEDESSEPPPPLGAGDKGDFDTGESEISPDSEGGDSADAEDGEASDSVENSTRAKAPAKKGTSDLSGVGKGSSNKLATLNTLSANPEIFRAILKNAMEFGDKLISKPSFRASDVGMLDRTLTFGQDLSRLPASELGRLGHKVARLSFLVDLANGNLLQYADLDPRRGPLVLMLDCSGSMMGSMYEIAAGFCLCLIHKMQQVGRGVALLKFSGNLEGAYVWDKHTKKPTLSEIARLLLSPGWGGTDFDEVLRSAFKVMAENNWNNCQGLLVSDGGGTVEQSTLDLRPANCSKLTAVMVSKKTKLTGFDEIVNVTRNQMALELTRVGNAMM